MNREEIFGISSFRWFLEEEICLSPYNFVSLRAQLNRGESREAVLPIIEKKRYNECLT
ncbi:hypothetical protein HMPREF9999_01584 [Alloprevotella sp. oral taxon 473 str. F0040]|nr:hypothetical protein HMPREF9999_01584 [Alloprevotella sp. oral taxon 473 str. F0040]